MEFSELLLSKKSAMEKLKGTLQKAAIGTLKPSRDVLVTISNPVWYSDETVSPMFTDLLLYLRQVIHSHNLDMEIYGYDDEIPLKNQLHGCSLVWDVTIVDHKLLGFCCRGSIFRIRYDSGTMFLCSVYAEDEDEVRYRKPYLESVGISYLDYDSDVSEAEIMEKAISSCYKVIERGLNILGRKDN